MINVDKTDSGIDSGSEDLISVNDSLSHEIVDIVEFYFSDDNLRRDAFLLKHVRKNKDGYVNVKLVASFRKVKHLTKKSEEVAQAIQNFSRKLVLNEERTKVRRIVPFALMSSKIGRTILVTSSTLELSVDNIREQLGTYGEMASICLHEGSLPTPFDELNVSLPRITSSFALVEYKSNQLAENAIKSFSARNQLNWRHSLRLELLTARPKAISKSPLCRQRSKTTSDVEQNVSARLNDQKVRSISCRVLSSCQKDGWIVRQPKGPDGTRGFSK